MFELSWQINNVFTEEKKPTRSQIIDWNMKQFAEEMRGNNLLLKDKFYLRELKRIKKNYPKLQIYVGDATNESATDKRHYCIIEKVV